MFGRIHEKLTGKVKDLSDSKGVQSGLNERTRKYHFGEVGFRCFLIPITFITTT